jgi:TatD DNase family protein
VGINLGDPVFRGIYHGKKGHEDDLDDVIQRAVDAGCIKMMITGSDLKESKHALDLAKQYRRFWFTNLEIVVLNNSQLAFATPP